ncbi:MAG: metallophosphoesterase family protein [Candidatus Ranarchaeia archaeon]
MTFRFAHIADCHIGAWRDKTLRELNIQAFEKALDTCVEQKVDFIILPGDLFDTNIPNLESVKRTALKMKEVKDKNIPLYVIYGSHDFSATGISMIDILQSTGLFEKVVSIDQKEGEEKIQLNFFQDPKTKAKITGISGRKRALEKEYYKLIDKNPIIKEKGFKIFLFHSAVDEYKPKNSPYSDSIPLSVLPPGFDYYGGGHIHKQIEQFNEQKVPIIWPGVLFGARFNDLEETATGNERGIYIVDFEKKVEKLTYIPIEVAKITFKEFKAEGKSAKQMENKLKEYAQNLEAQNKIVLIKVTGKLETGKPSEINFKEILETVRKSNPITVNLNRYGLSTKERATYKVRGENKSEIETNIFKEMLEQFKIDKEIKPLAKQRLENLVGKQKGQKTAEKMLDLLKSEKKENENARLFEDRIWQDIQALLKIGGKN